MYCDKCGSKIPEMVHHCPVCGATVPGYDKAFNEIDQINSMQEMFESNAQLDDGEGETTVLRADMNMSQNEQNQPYTPVNESNASYTPVNIPNPEYTPVGQSNASYTPVNIPNPEYTPVGQSNQAYTPVGQPAPSYRPIGQQGNHSDMPEEMHLAERADEVKKDKKKGFGKAWKITILIMVLCALAIGAVTVVTKMMQGRSQKETIRQYEEALNNRNNEDMLGLMFPKEYKESGRNEFKEGNMNLISWSSDLKNDCGVVTMELEDTVDVDEEDAALRKDVEDMLLNKLDISYDDMVVAKLDVTYSQKKSDKLSKVIMYQVDKSWYILPGCLQFVIEERQNADIEQAKTLKKKLHTCLEKDEVWKSMASYYNMPISMPTDIEYLPEVFRDVYQKEVGTIDALRHTVDGAVGYAFSFDESGKIKMYISSETCADEWEVIPDVSERYDTGEKQEDSGSTDDTYAYIKLISEKSPLLGYWQAGNAGMYIGYNTSGGKEGFTVYYALEDGACNILNTVGGYRCSGGNGSFQFSGNGTYDFSINGENALSLQVNGGSSYQFTKKEIEKSVKEEFAGTWIVKGGTSGEIGAKMSLAVCDMCGFVHVVDEEQASNKYHTNPVVELYNGSILQYLFPTQGLVASTDGTTPITWTGEQWQRVEEDNLTYYVYAVGSGEETCLYVDGESKEGKALEAVTAYQKYLEKQNVYYDEYAMIYLDGNDTPELVTMDYDNTPHLFTYYGDNVTEHHLNYSRLYDLVYYERQGKFWFNTYYMQIEILHAGQLSNGKFSDYEVAADDETQETPQFYVGGNLASYADYENTVNNAYNRDTAKGIVFYNSLEKAYAVLLQ